MRHAQLGLTVNGESHEVSFAPYKTLLEVLREDLGLTGTKHGCELGECGACAVLIDGEPQLSCLVLALECEGRSIDTARRRVDGRAKVTGQTRFADDVVLPRMLHMKLLRSPHAHALVEEINV